MSLTDDEKEILAGIEAAMREEQRKSQPDYRIDVYCDQHLSVQMRFADSYIMAEYGEASADCNQLIYWRCPKLGCNRCYEPMMYGYCWYSAEMGSRIVSNPNKQRQCNHQELPFLYIAKVGQGRQYLCPLYKCKAVGDEVSPSIVDEVVEMPKDPLEGLGKDQRKAFIEMSVFKSFAAVSGLAIDEGSTESVDPPNPDIRCTISGKPHWFELGQIISETVAQKISPKQRAIGGAFSFSQEKPFVEIMRKKAKKTYETQGIPVDLVLHFDLRLGSKSVVLRQIEKHDGLLKSLASVGPFARIWIYDAWTKCILWERRD
jgi:hypothetical protein